MAFLMPHEMKLAESGYNTWAVTVPEGVTLDQLQEPIYWTHVAGQLTKWDRIWCQYEHTDGMWLAEFVVTAIDPEKKIWAKVKVIAQHMLVKGIPRALPEKPLEDKDFEIKLRTPNGWSVIRKADGSVMYERGKLPDDANRWLRDYKAKVAA